MSAPCWPTVELGGGTGVVAAFAGVALLVVDGDQAEVVVDDVREAASLASPPGRPLARRLAALLAGPDADRLPDFGVVAECDDTWVVLLHGAVDAVVTVGGAEETLSGTAAATWTDRLVASAVESVLLVPAGSARPGTSPLRVDAGVVPGGWLRVTTAASEEPPPPPVGFELFSLDADGVEPHPPLPVEGVEQSPASTLDHGRETLHAAGLATAHADGAGPAAWPAPVDDRASLGLLVFDDGSVFGLDEDYVLGREPEIDDAVVAGTARPITLDDPAGTVSRVHAVVHRAVPDVLLIDRGSTNGTHVWDGAKGAWDRLAPDEPRVIRPGERGAVGRRTFVFEALAPAAGTAPHADRHDQETVEVSPPPGALVNEDGAVHPLDRSYVIGREPLGDDVVRDGRASPIVIRDDEISRVHAYLTVADGTVTVRDAGTLAGTFVAAPGASEWDVVGTDPVELPPGWSVSFGAHVFTHRGDG